MKEVNTQNLWTFELGTQKGIITAIWIIVNFQQRVRQESQNFNINTFYRSPVTSAQGITGTEQNIDNIILINCDDDD